MHRLTESDVVRTQLVLDTAEGRLVLAGFDFTKVNGVIANAALGGLSALFSVSM